MTAFLTICSANYLAQAKTLMDSTREYHPEAQTVIGLVDRIPAALLPTYCMPHLLLPVEELAIPAFGTMAAKYNIVELNTAVKPFYIEHLYRDASVNEVIYLDPDILVMGSFAQVLERLSTHLLVLTPHCVTPSDLPAAVTMQLDMLKTGVYNLGFLGTSRKGRLLEFLRWWQRRLEEYCYYRTDLNLFVDQIWMVLAPHFFDDAWVEKGLGYNVCYWNAYERQLTCNDGRYYVNGRERVVFYHFSSFDPNRPDIMVSRYNTPFPGGSEPRGLFDAYRARLLRNGFETVRLLPCAFAELPPSQPVETGALLSAKRVIQRVIRWTLKLLPSALRKLLKRSGQFLMDNS